jgi:tetratricopeptide (TPR) repeat protein
MGKQRNATLEALLKEHGYTHDRLADKVNEVSGLMFGKAANCSDRHVRRWISGEVTWPWNRYLLPLTEVFQRPPEAMGFIPRGKSTRLPAVPISAVPRPSRPKRRSVVAASAAATLAGVLGIDQTPDCGRLAMSDVQRIESTVGRLDAHFNGLGGGPVLQVATAYIERVRAAIDGCAYGPRVEIALYETMSALYSTASLAARDCEQHERAHHLCATALQAAMLAGSPRAQARAWADLAALARIDQRHREAVRISRSALDVRAIRNDARITALLWARLAIGQAYTGEQSAASRSLVAAERAFDRVGDDTPPPWLAVLDHAELSGLAGIAHQAMGKYAMAEAATAQALDLMSPTLRRNRAYYTVQLAELQLAHGRRDEAAAVAESVDVSVIKSQRVAARLSAVHRALGGPT